MESSRRRGRDNGAGVGRKRQRFNHRADDGADDGDDAGDGSRRLSKRVRQHIEVLDSTVMVRNLDDATTSQNLREFFENYGDVEQIRMVPAQGYGFVTFAAKEIAQGVIVASQDKEGIRFGVRNRKVQITWAAAGFSAGDEETSNNNKRTKRGLSATEEDNSYNPAKRVRKRFGQKRNQRQQHDSSLPQQCKSRLFISAVASAVASTNSESVPQVPQILHQRPSLVFEKVPPLPDRQVIAYDDWL